MIYSQMGGTVIREYLERARAIVAEKGLKSEEMEKLRKEVAETTDPFIRNVLNM